MGIDGGAQPRIDDVSVIHGIFVIAADPDTDIDVGAADGLLPDVADFDPTSAWGGGDEVMAAMPDGADFDPTSLDSAWGDGDDATAAVPAAGASTQTATSTATHLAAPSPLDVTRDADDGTTADTASATDTGMGVDTDPNPATTGLPAAEHISSFLLRIRRCADDRQPVWCWMLLLPIRVLVWLRTRLLVSPSL